MISTIVLGFFLSSPPEKILAKPLYMPHSDKSTNREPKLMTIIKHLTLMPPERKLSVPNKQPILLILNPLVKAKLTFKTNFSMHVECVANLSHDKMLQFYN